MGLNFSLALTHTITWVKGHDEFTLPTETERRANKRNYDYPINSNLLNTKSRYSDVVTCLML